MRNKVLVSIGVPAWIVISAAVALAQTSASAPWSEKELRAALQPGFTTVYDRTGTNDKGKAVSGTQRFEVKEVYEPTVAIDSTWEDPGTKERSSGNKELQWKNARFMASFSNSESRVLGSEKVETPAGTFDTVKVEVTNDFFKTRQIYWMIPDQPGVYARYEDFGKNGNQDIVMTLRKVTRPQN